MKRLQRFMKDILTIEYNNKKYKKFSIILKPIEQKTVLEKYNYETNKIEIYTLSRNSKQLILSALHGLAHHINYIDNNNINHNKKFYEIYADLVNICLIHNTLSKNDLKNNFRKDEYLLNIALKRKKRETKIINNIINNRYIFLENVYKKHEILKRNGFYWETIEKKWFKEFDKNDIDKIRMFLKKEKLLNKAIIEPKSKLTILPQYSIYLIGGFNFKKELKEKGYRWNKNEKKWEKNILSKNYIFEKKYAVLKKIKIEIKKY